MTNQYRHISAAGDPFVAAARNSDEDLQTHYSSLERPCFACYNGYVYMGVEDEDGEEVIEPVRCRRCSGS